MAAYTTIDNPELYFQVKTYTGNGSTQSITLDGDENMSPNFVWIKARSSGQENILFDTVRGVTNWLQSDNTSAEADQNTSLTSFDSDGFSLADIGEVNANTYTYVAWCWKAGTSFSNDASATSIGTIDTTGSVSETSGFSIISYDGTGANGTIKHGLSTAPRTMLFKNRDEGAEGWFVYHESIGNTKRLLLDDTSTTSTSSTFYQDTSPTSSIITLGSNHGCNGPDAMICYAFSERQGFSKFGSYTGNGNADGTYVHLGFRPAWVMVKETGNVNSWRILDNKRDTFNVMTKPLYANLNNAEGSSGHNTDFTAQGFKIRDSDTSMNRSGGSFIFMAFAEAPFVNSKGVPANAR